MTLPKNTPPFSLDQLQVGQIAFIKDFAKETDARILELGITRGTPIELAHVAPFGGAITVKCRGALIAMRNEMARKIFIQLQPLTEDTPS